MLPVVLPGCSADDIPDWLGPAAATYYTVNDYTVAGAERLLRALTGQPGEIEPERGPRPHLPPHGGGAVAAEMDRLAPGDTVEVVLAAAGPLLSLPIELIRFVHDGGGTAPLGLMPGVSVYRRPAGAARPGLCRTQGP